MKATGIVRPVDELGRIVIPKELRRTLGIALEEQLRTCDNWIAMLPKQKAKVMRLYYVDGLYWMQVAEKTHYSTRHCRRINSAVLEKMSDNVRFFCDKV